MKGKMMTLYIILGTYSNKGSEGLEKEAQTEEKLWKFLLQVLE